MKRWSALLAVFLLAACSSPAIHDGGPEIEYHRGVKYSLHAQYQHQTDLRCTPYDTDLLTLTVSGLLVIHPGYAWDGCSGPCIDTDAIMRAALVHDAIYELIRHGACPQSQKALADRLFQTLYAEDAARLRFGWPLQQLSKWRDDWVYWAVDHFGSSSVQPKAERPVLTAP